MNHETSEEREVQATILDIVIWTTFPLGPIIKKIDGHVLGRSFSPQPWNIASCAKWLCRVGPLELCIAFLCVGCWVCYVACKVTRHDQFILHNQIAPRHVRVDLSEKERDFCVGFGYSYLLSFLQGGVIITNMTNIWVLGNRRASQ